MINQDILKRMDELIEEGEKQWWDFQKTKNLIKDPVRFTQWTTSCLNLLDKLSISTNRFVTEFEEWAKRAPGREINLGAALGVLKAAREEYIRGFAIEYHLAVASAVFNDILQEAEYLFQKGYFRAAAVLCGAALEEALKSRARSIPIELSGKETLTPLLHKLKAPEIGVLTEVQAKSLEVVGTIRNDAAHGGSFNYGQQEVERAIKDVREALGYVLGEKSLVRG